MIGTAAMFRGNISPLIFILILFFFLQSCEVGKSSNTCEWEKENYHESWDYVVDTVYKHPDGKSTFVIETTSGKTILFRPIQDIVSYAEPGDRIVKDEDAQFAFLIDKNGKDSLRSRIFSTGCDSLVGVKDRMGKRFW